MRKREAFPEEGSCFVGGCGRRGQIFIFFVRCKLNVCDRHRARVTELRDAEVSRIQRIQATFLQTVADLGLEES